MVEHSDFVQVEGDIKQDKPETWYSWETLTPDPTENRRRALLEAIETVDECQCFRGPGLKEVADEKLKKWIDELDRLIMGDPDQTPEEIVEGIRKARGLEEKDIDLVALAEEIRKA